MQLTNTVAEPTEREEKRGGGVLTTKLQGVQHRNYIIMYISNSRHDMCIPDTSIIHVAYTEVCQLNSNV